MQIDFFDRQDQARRNTKRLIAYFALGVGLMAAAIYLALLILFAGVNSRLALQGRAFAPVSFWNPSLFWGATLGTLAVIGLGSAFKTIELAQGGAAVASMLGGRLVAANTSDPNERKLLDVVEEMALASGVPAPPAYLLDDEPGINAFAAGHSTSDAVVTVTRGCLQALSRDELQGVIGHEFSHILNGDMRLNLRLIGLIFGILCLAVIGRILLQTRGRSSRDRNALPLLGLILLAIGSVGAFFGRLIQAAVSRQREFLADASSVQFTRNPAGLVGALKKIGGLRFGSKIEAPHAHELSHMFFGNGLSEPVFGWLATHPPLEERIRAIDPSFDGVFPPVTAAYEGGSAEALPTARLAPETRLTPPLAAQAALAGALGGAPPPVIAASHARLSFNAATQAHLQYAADLRDSLPDKVRLAARDPLGASALIYALLLSPEPSARDRQEQLIPDAARNETERLLPDVAPVAARAKLPLVALALPSLRHFSPAQFQEFNQTIQRLIEDDGQVDLFEYMLQKIVLRHLAPQFTGARKPTIQYYAIRPLAGECGILLSAMAHAGAEDPARAEAAFQKGAEPLGALIRSPIVFAPAEQCQLSQLDAALDRLSLAAPQIKKNILSACVETVAADGVVREPEAELLRAIADALDCPMPPFLEWTDQPAPAPAPA